MISMLDFAASRASTNEAYRSYSSAPKAVLWVKDDRINGIDRQMNEGLSYMVHGRILLL